jgi:hypothetical protein
LKIMTGETISHYRVLREIGSGGMGVFYEAEDLKLGRRAPSAVTPRFWISGWRRSRKWTAG